MAKTDFTNGANAWETWFNSHYVTDGGHKHDGANNDGHSSKILLTNAAHVTGVLPLDNAGVFNQLSLQTHASDFTAQRSVICKVFQQTSMMGSFVKLTHLYFDSFEANDGIGDSFRLSTAIAEAYRPAENIYVPIICNTYNVLVSGMVAITTDGVVGFSLANAITSPVVGITFQNIWSVGVKGFKAFGLSYVTE